MRCVTWFLNILFLLGSLTACRGQSAAPAPAPGSPDGFIKGADVSWLTQQEAAGVRFYQPDGKVDDLLNILKAKGINTIRLRVWVNPQGGWNNANDVLAKAKRVKAANLKLLLNFHYSDSWADPGKQTKPVAWKNLNFTDLKKALGNHTTDVLTLLTTNGIVPDWVQIGNETNNGMLWPDGQASTNMANYAALVKTGYEAVKAVSPTSQVMVHVSNGYDKNLFRWNIGGLAAHNTPFDLIGLSLYPTASDWATKNEQCLATINDLIASYKRPIMVVEIGMPANDPATANAFISDLITRLRAVPDNKAQGVMYWEPQAYGKWEGYGLGAFDDAGKPTVALDAFLK